MQEITLADELGISLVAISRFFF